MEGLARRLTHVERAIRQVRCAINNVVGARQGLFPNNSDPLYTSLRLAAEGLDLAMADLVSARLELHDLQRKESTP